MKTIHTLWKSLWKCPCSKVFFCCGVLKTVWKYYRKKLPKFYIVEILFKNSKDTKKKPS